MNGWMNGCAHVVYAARSELESFRTSFLFFFFLKHKKRKKKKKKKKKKKTSKTEFALF